MRTETGYQDRDQYRIAVLFRPGEAVDGVGAAGAVQPQAADHTTARAAASTTRPAARPTSWTTAALRSRGFAVDVDRAQQRRPQLQHRHAGRVADHGQGAHRRAATATLRYTIGTGCSGGSLTQQQVANAYPGIYQGILPACSFPDAWSTGQQLAAYNLLRRYVENPTKWAPGVVWDPVSIGAVEGHPNHVNSIVFDSVYWTDLGVPDDGCAGVPAEQVYNAGDEPRRHALHARRTT